MGAFHKYPEIVTLHKRPEILAVKEVIAHEKLHGTHFRLFLPAGMTAIAEVRFGGRNEVFGTDDGEKFYGGRPVRWFKQQPALLERMFLLFRERGYGDVIVYGEMCGVDILKGVRYTPDNEMFFRAFDICLGEHFVTHDLFVAICEAVGLPRAPEVWRGEPSHEAFDALLEQPSVEGQRHGIHGARNLMEGVVIRSNPLLRTVCGEWLIIKHKSAQFTEVVQEHIRQTHLTLTQVEAFARQYVVRGRILNALGRLCDAGITVTNSMADMAVLAPAIVADLHKECAPEWQALVAQGCSDKRIRSTVGKTLAAVYNRMLEDRTDG